MFDFILNVLNAIYNERFLLQTSNPITNIVNVP